MRLYELVGSECINDRMFPMGSTVLQRENGDIIVCVSFTRCRLDSKIPVSLYIKETGQWKSGVMKNQFTEILWNYHKQQKARHRTGKAFRGNYAGMMKHSRQKKGGTGGERLTPFCGQVTDYECRKDPMWDFARVWN